MWCIKIVTAQSLLKAQVQALIIMKDELSGDVYVCELWWSMPMDTYWINRQVSIYVDIT